MWKDGLIKSIVTGIIITAMVGYLMYDCVWIVVFSPFAIWLISKREKQQRLEKRKARLKYDFEIVMSSIATDLEAGLSMENAWKGALVALQTQGNREAGIMEEKLVEIIRGMQMNIPIEQLLSEFAEESQVEDIQNFAEIFNYAKRSGGNTIYLINQSVRMLQEKYEIEKEIEVLIASKKLEQRVMNVIPVFMLIYLRLSSEEYMSVLYHSLLGEGIMTICLLAYLLAIRMSNKIVRIAV